MTCLLADLLGAEIVGLFRVEVDNPSLGQRYVAKSALVLVLADGRRFEMLTGQSRTVVVELSGQLLLMNPDEPKPQADPDEELSLRAPTGEVFDRLPRLPVRVDRVTEVWAGRDDKAFMAAIMIDSTGVEGSTRLDLCVETDEIEVMTAEELLDRLKEIERSYGSIVYRHYGG